MAAPDPKLRAIAEAAREAARRDARPFTAEEAAVLRILLTPPTQTPERSAVA